MEVWNDALEPLGKLKIALTFDTKEHRVKNVKNEKHRDVPVHPALAETLRAWKTTGWATEFGREPEPDDLVVPDEDLGHRTNKQTRTRLYSAFKALGLRQRRFHDGRRTFTSMLRERDVPREKVEWIKDGPRRTFWGGTRPFRGLLCATQS